jgi:hypothetical protein
LRDAVVFEVDEELGSGRVRVWVRAMAMLPASFLRPLRASFSMGARVVFSSMRAVHASALDHEAVDDSMKDQAIVDGRLFTYSRKFATVLGAFSG